MNYFSELKDILSLFISLIGVIITSVLTWMIFKKENNKAYLKDRYEKVIFPIFSLLEPHLYTKEITDEIRDVYKKCKNILCQNKIIAGGNLLYIFSLPCTSSNFKAISKTIEKEYDSCCISLGIPIRPLEYKIDTFRFRNIKVTIIFFIKYSLPLLPLIFMILAFAKISTIYS